MPASRPQSTSSSDSKKVSKQIDLADLLIAATAQQNGLPLATLNTKHFSRIEGLEVVSK
jgi:tRNA(fMet)-specific endonuclease VapC